VTSGIVKELCEWNSWRELPQFRVIYADFKYVKIINLKGVAKQEDDSYPPPA
jgi:hypothetical protein